MSPLFALGLAGRAGAAEAIPPFTRVALLGDPSPGDIQPMTDSQGALWRQVAVRLKQQVERVETLRPDPANWKVDSVTLSGKYLDSVLSSGAEACLVSVDTYDYDYYTGRSPEESAATVAAVCKKLADHGIVPILGGALPSGQGWMATRAPWVVRERELLAQVAAADPRILDLAWERTLDPDGDGVGDPQYYALAMLKEEGVNQLAARAAEVLAPHVRPRDVMAGVQWLTPNAELRITPDRSPGNFVPSGWANYPAGTLSDYVYPRSPALGQWWQMKLPPVGRAEIFFEGITQELNQTLQPGERIEFVVEYETDADVSADFEVFAELARIGNRGPLGRLAGGVAVSAPQEIHEVTTAAEPRIVIVGSGTVRLGRMGVRKIRPWAPGPYADDLTALLKGGVKAGEIYSDAQENVHTAGPAAVRKLALWGDALMENATEQSWTVRTGNAAGPVLYQLRGELADPETYTVTQQRHADGDGPLEVAMNGHALTVTLRSVDGRTVSTVDEVGAAVVLAYRGVFLPVAPGPGRGGEVADELGTAYFVPEADKRVVNPFVWLQVLLRQRFELAQRLQNHGAGGGGLTGDWDFGTPGADADELARNPGPLGDVLGSDAEVIVGSVGLSQKPGPLDAETEAGKILHLWDLLDAAGRAYVWLEVLPAADLLEQPVVRDVNARLREAAAARGVRLLAWPAELAAADGTASPEYFSDSSFPTDAGALKMAQSVAGFFDTLVQPQAPDYARTAGTWLTANPAMAGNHSGGATGWFNRTPQLLKLAKVDSPAKTGVWQSLTVKRAVPDQGEDAVLTSYEAADAAPQPGELVEGVAEIEMDPGQGLDLNSVSVSVLLNGGNRGRVTALRTLRNEGDFTTGKSLASGVIRTPAFRVPGGGPLLVELEVRSHGAGTFRIRNAGVRRAVYPIDPQGPVAVEDVPDARSTPLAGQRIADPAKAAGTYAGTFYEMAPDGLAGEQPTRQAVGGFDSFLLGKTGAFTARGTLGGRKFVVKGQLLNQDFLTEAVLKLADGSTARMTIHLDAMQDGTIRLTGRVTEVKDASGAATGGAYGLDLVRSGGAEVAAAQAGYYTAVIPGMGRELPAEPEGHGLAMMTLQANGALRCRYLLADGTVGTRSAKIGGGAKSVVSPSFPGSSFPGPGDAPVWKFYFPLTGPGVKGGLMAGEVAFRHVEARPDFNLATDVDGQVTFSRPANPRAALFPAGYAVQRDLLGAKYVAAAKGQLPLPDMRPVGPAGSGVDANAGLIVDDSPSPVAWLVTDRIVAPGVALKLDRKTGLISGTVVREGTKTKLAVHALVMPNYRLALGFYQGKGEVGSLLVSPDHFE